MHHDSDFSVEVNFWLYTSIRFPTLSLKVTLSRYIRVYGGRSHFFIRDQYTKISLN